MIHHPHFFGYGSLVNTATHSYPGIQHATLQGWRRVWRHTTHRMAAFLTVRPDATTTLEGLIAAVPDADWHTLDAREYAYDRHKVTPQITAANIPCGTAVYAVPGSAHIAPSATHPILLSYLDVVVQGYLHRFGEDGVARFFETTDGWHTPILNDRMTPRYPRAQTLTKNETALVDHFIAVNSTSSGAVLDAQTDRDP